MRPEEIKKAAKYAKDDFAYKINVTGDYRDTWRIFRIMSEFVEGYQFMAKMEKEVTILGSARFNEDNEHYKTAREIGKILGKNGFTVITGGGPGIMEAANRGAHEVGGESVGLNIQLPFEQRINPYVQKSIAFYYFFTRKVMMMTPADAFVYCPGGFGTLDEFFEVVDLMDLNKMPKSPIILVNKKFWAPLLSFLREKVVPLGSITDEQIDSWHVVDTAEEAYEIIKTTKDRKNNCEMTESGMNCNVKLDWKIFRIMSELVEGFEFLNGVIDDVTVLGTKDISPDSEYYESAYELGATLSAEKYMVITGGGPGIMEAANKGAFENGGKSLGVNMRYGYKERVNPYLNKSIGFQFPFVRKLIITSPSKAFVFYPGGFGTMHQLFEVLTLIQTKKMEKIPVILYDHKFWGPMHEFIKKTMVHDEETVGDLDDELYQIVDSVDGIMKVIKDADKKRLESK